MLGERVAGKYELRRLLGTGAMGAVYEGVHVDIGKRLAIKLIHAEYCDSPEIVGRFRREARAASAVESDYIVQVYDFGRDDRLGLYMVIEYLEGEDLATRLSRERWIADRETATIGVQVARGLAKAHAAGIVHRDLKPANVFLTMHDDGTVLAKILDFGISKFEPERAPASMAEPTLTAYGTTLGTPQYMSPEQCMGTELDGRTDVWSLAAVLYEMIAGEPAVADAGVVPTMQRIVSDGVAPLATRASWASGRLASAIDAGLARDRARRPDAAAFALGLLDAFPDAASKPSLAQVARATDASELAPGSVPPSGLTVRDLPVLAPPPAPEVRLADTGNPQSADPPSSGEEGVRVFSRGEVLAELKKGKTR